MTNKDMKQAEAVAAPEGKAGQSPFFRALVKDGLGRRFTKASRNPNRRIPYKGNTLLIDARHNAVWTEQFLSDELNIDMIASRLVDKATRESVLDFLKTPDN